MSFDSWIHILELFLVVGIAYTVFEVVRATRNANVKKGGKKS